MYSAQYFSLYIITYSVYTINITLTMKTEASKTEHARPAVYLNCAKCMCLKEDDH